MSEASRQRFLHVKNRLEELARKHGPPEESATPDWLDSYDGFMAMLARRDAEEATVAPPAHETTREAGSRPARVRPQQERFFGDIEEDDGHDHGPPG